MSTPPSGSVYFGPGTTGGAPYTGGEYAPDTYYRDPFEPQLPIDTSNYGSGGQQPAYSPPPGGGPGGY